MYRVCPEKKRGLPSRIRPDGSRFEDHTGERGTENLAAQCLLSYVGPHEESAGREWLVDSGCNRHMTPHKEDLIDISDDNTVCKFGNEEKTEAKGQGNVVMNCKDERGRCVKIKITGCFIYTVTTTPDVFIQASQREKRRIPREKKGDSSIILPVSNARISLSEFKGFVWLREPGHGQNEINEMTSKCKVERLDEIRKDEVTSSTAYAPGSRETAEVLLLD